MKQDNVNLSIVSMDHFEILQRILEQEGSQPAAARSCSGHLGYCIKIATTSVAKSTRTNSPLTLPGTISTSLNVPLMFSVSQWYCDIPLQLSPLSSLHSRHYWEFKGHLLTLDLLTLCLPVLHQSSSSDTVKVTPWRLLRSLCFACLCAPHVRPKSRASEGKGRNVWQTEVKGHFGSLVLHLLAL